MIEKLSIFLLIILMFNQVVYSNITEYNDAIIDLDKSSSNFEYLYFDIDNNSLTNKVAYEITNGDESYMYLQMNIIFNNQSIEDKCLKQLNLSKDTIFKKITCEVPKLGEGEYILNASILDVDNNVLMTVISKEYIFKDSWATLKIADLENNRTEIIIEVNGIDKNLLVQSYIPKSVIEYLDNTNRYDLIETKDDYMILDADPLIAWDIDRPPRTINYTVNKKITQLQKNEFKIDIVETKTFKMFRYIVFCCILVIVLLVFKPLFSNVKKKFKRDIS